MTTTNIIDALAKVAGSLARMDGWQNLVTGLGTLGRDKLAWHAPTVVTALDPLYCLALYDGDALAARIVDKPIDDAMRKGFILHAPPETDEAVVERIEERFGEVDAWTALEGAWRWGRAMGAGYVMIGANDGGAMDMPLAPERVRSVDYLHVLDALEATVATTYDDPLDPRFGRPAVYRVQPQSGKGSPLVLVHASRMVEFGGVQTTRRQRAQNGGRDFSVFQRVVDALRRFDSDWRSASAMMSDGSQGVLKIKGFADVLAGGSKDLFAARMEIVNLCRSVSRIMPIDADTEEFSYVERSWAGVADLLDKTTLYLAACSGMPVTVLFGRSPAGMDATGEGDRIGWYDTVQALRDSVLMPRARTLLDLVLRAEGVDPTGWWMDCPALLQESEADLATRRKSVADTDVLYINAQVVEPEQVAIARFGLGEWSDRAIEVDVEAAEALLAMDRERGFVDDPVEPVDPPAAPAPTPDTDDEVG